MFDDPAHPTIIVKGLKRGSAMADSGELRRRFEQQNSIGCRAFNVSGLVGYYGICTRHADYQYLVRPFLLDLNL